MGSLCASAAVLSVAAAATTTTGEGEAERYATRDGTRPNAAGGVTNSDLPEPEPHRQINPQERLLRRACQESPESDYAYRKWNITLVTAETLVT